MSHPSTRGCREGAGTSSSSHLAGIGAPAPALPEQPALPATSLHHPPPCAVRKEWKDPCNQLLTIFFENLFLHLVPHVGAVSFFYLDVSVRIEEMTHRAYGSLLISQILPDHHSKRVSQALRGGKCSERHLFAVPGRTRAPPSPPPSP